MDSHLDHLVGHTGTAPNPCGRAMLPLGWHGCLLLMGRHLDHESTPPSAPTWWVGRYCCLVLSPRTLERSRMYSTASTWYQPCRIVNGSLPQWVSYSDQSSIITSSLHARLSSSRVSCPTCQACNSHSSEFRRRPPSHRCHGAWCGPRRTPLTRFTNRNTGWRETCSTWFEFVCLFVLWAFHFCREVLHM